MKRKIDKWVDILTNETQVDDAFYELIQHKTNFFQDGILQFSGWELIVEVYSDESQEEFVHNIYPELICGEASVIAGDLDNKNFETFIIDNTPEYNSQELTNGLSRIKSGNRQEIAHEINSLKSYSWNRLLVIDKKDFTYFNNVRSYVSFEQLYQNEDNSVNLISSNIIGSEVYLYTEILRLDKLIKRSINFANFVTQQYFIEKGCDKIELPFIAEPIEISNGVNFYDFSKRQNDLIETLALKNNLEADDIKGYLNLKDFKLPAFNVFMIKNSESIELIQNYLELIYKHSYVFFEAVFYKLMSYNTCLWKVYPNILTQNVTSKILIDESKKYNPDRFIFKKFKNYEEFQNNDNAYEFLFKDEYLSERRYQCLEKDLTEFLNYKFESENDFQAAIIHFNNEDWVKAINDFNKCIKHNPNREEAFFNRALAKYEIDDIDGALNDLNEGLKIKKSSEFYYMLGLIHDNKLNDQEKAIEFYSMSINFNSDYLDSYINRGQIYLDKKLYSDALKDFNNVIKFEENNFNATLGRAITFFEMNRYNESLSDFKIIKALRPEHDAAENYIIKINNYIKSGELKSNEYSEFMLLIKRANVFIKRHFELIEMNAPSKILEQREIRIYSITNDLNQLSKKFKNKDLKREMEFKVSKIYFNIGEIKVLLFEKDKSKNDNYEIAIKCFEHSASLKYEKALKALKKYRAI